MGQCPVPVTQTWWPSWQGLTDIWLTGQAHQCPKGYTRFAVDSIFGFGQRKDVGFGPRFLFSDTKRNGM